MDADTLDICKENIQPLKQGRRAGKLGLALLAQTDADVQQQLMREREQYELEIMTYDGPDPLSPRYDYVHWVEQSCPKHGKEVNLVPLLEDTIMLFKEDDRYKQDKRFVELIIKYIETQDNPIELFQMVFAQGLGMKCASFYKAWADQLDAINDLQRADQVYQRGLANGAEPKSDIEQAHLFFQLSVGRRMMMGQLADREKPVSSETAERQRRVLGRIKKTSSHRPSSGLPGKLQLPLSNRPQSSSAITVFQEDENGCPSLDSSKAKLVVNAENSRKENTVKPGPWNQGIKRRPAPVTSVPSTPNFKVLVDEEDEDATPLRPMTVTPVPANVLKTRKAEFKHRPSELFKSPHPSSKPPLPVLEAFTGGKEFSYEELRWAYLRKKMSTKDDICVETPAKELSTPRRVAAPPASPALATPSGSSLSEPNSFKTPMTRAMYSIAESTEDDDLGVYTILDTPVAPTSDASAENIISRPRLYNAVKAAPFVISQDEDD